MDECPDGCGIDPETDDWSDAHYCGECGMNHAFPGEHGPVACPFCGNTVTVELSRDDQTITVCAECGAD